MRDFTLTAPNRAALWTSLALTKTQLAEICGLTTRQVSHWTSQRYITTSERHPDRYNGETVDLCVLIKQGLSSGVPLRRSVRMAREFLANEQAHQPGLRSIDPPELRDIYNRLSMAGSAITSVLEVVTPLVPQQGRNDQRD